MSKFLTYQNNSFDAFAVIGVTSPKLVRYANGTMFDFNVQLGSGHTIEMSFDNEAEAQKTRDEIFMKIEDITGKLPSPHASTVEEKTE